MKYPPIQYHDYLALDQILNGQKLRSVEFKNPAHDEMLFIIVHQTYELWFRQVLFELESILCVFGQSSVADTEISTAVSRLQRIVTIQKHINNQIDILETMTPLDFLEFRDYLYPASGFQSFQWRKIETLLGLKISDRLQYNNTPFFNHLQESQKIEIQDLINKPTLFDLVDQWLARTPFLAMAGFDFWKEYQNSVETMLADDRAVIETNPRLSGEDRARNLKILDEARKMFSALFSEEEFAKLQAQGHFRLSYRSVHAALLIQLYRDQPIFHLPFRLMSSLLDLDEHMTQWRYRHSQMVHRMLGSKIGTGGSSGHDYLKATTEKHKIFSDFFNLSTFFIPRSKVPRMPRALEEKMGYSLR